MTTRFVVLGRSARIGTVVVINHPMVQSREPLRGGRGGPTHSARHLCPVPLHRLHLPLPWHAPQLPGPEPLSPVPPQTPWHFPLPPQDEHAAIASPPQTVGARPEAGASA